ncbi:Pentatricopeptide repeat-containing protein [Artemisia annua]|uniref:Pentatricopeptide repeat-containing protein n=1 Tax=Artemisia annua TaxID=35608 RepID=A0A2U1M784_ARTAN|nr:Pentatricopeptide repeat-containing protein [Artemisia annua]
MWRFGCARNVFDKIVERDLVSWNLMISGCVKIGFAKGALELFEDMKRDGFDPDEMTAVSVLRECGDIGNLELGKVVEEYFVENEMEMNYYVGLVVARKADGSWSLPFATSTFGIGWELSFLSFRPGKRFVVAVKCNAQDTAANDSKVIQLCLDIAEAHSE